MNILVLCTGNSCRSQMMHGFLKQDERFTVYSAGIETHGVNPKAIKTMAEVDIDISNHTSNHVDEYSDVAFDYMITVCDHAKENCPYLPSDAERLHHNFPDPAKATGTDEEIFASFRSTRDLIADYAQNFLANVAKK